MNKYCSNLHNAINGTGSARYFSIPFTTRNQTIQNKIRYGMEGRKSIGYLSYNKCFYRLLYQKGIRRKSWPSFRVHRLES